MRKIFYLILLLALVACKGQQQTAESESVADPATESVNPEMGKTMVKARRCHCTARSGCNHFRHFPPQSGFVQRPDRPSAPTAGNRRTDYRRSDQKHFLTPRTTRYQEFCNRHFGESGVYHPPTDLSGQPRTNRISAYGIRTAKESLCRTSGFAEEVPAKQSGLSFDEKPSGCCRHTTSLLGVNPETLLRDGIQPLLEVKAPISGYVVNVAMNMGKYINPGEALCEVIDKSAPMLCLTTYEKDLADMQTGSPVQFRVNGMGTQTFNGTVISIGQKVDEVNRSLEVYASIKETNPQFRPGMYVTAHIQKQ